MVIDIEVINDAFTPSQEIITPERFVGRYDEIEESIISLATKGSFLSIFGIRGIGKSSIAYQIKLIAEGNKILPKVAQLEHMLPKKGFNYLVHLVKCDAFVKDIPTLINRILLGDDENPSIFSHNNEGDKRVIAYKEKLKANGGLNMQVFKAGLETEEERTYEIIKSDDLIQEFKQALSTTRKDNQNKTGLLILIDEFDIIKDKSGFASLIKTSSSDFVKFGIVGIGDSIEDLVEDHSSISRQINNIFVKSMPQKELKQIIQMAEQRLKNKIKFSTDVIDEITKDAEGFPYFVHLLGREALIMALKRKEKVIHRDIYDEVKDKLLNGKMSISQEAKYVDICRTSPEREFLLKLFADVDENYILTESIYEQAREFGIEKPSQYMDEFRGVKNIHPVLIQSKDGRHVRFSDPILKIYAKKRNSIHDKY